MKVEVLPATWEDKSILRRMIELYQYDFSEFDGADLDAHGSYGYAYLDYYWLEESRHPFLVRVDGKLAGFVLVRDQAYLPGNQRSIAEFFILRKYRRRGVGRQVAFHIFDLFPGKWEVTEIEANLPAQQFWRRVIGEYTGGKFQETWLEDGGERGLAQSFESR